jgi:hypothetical protein
MAHKLTKAQLDKLVAKLKWGEKVKVAGRWFTKTQLVRTGLGEKPQVCGHCNKPGHNKRTCARMIALRSASAGRKQRRKKAVA